MTETAWVMYDDYGHSGCGEPMAIWLSKPSPEAVRRARKESGAINEIDDRTAREIVETGQSRRHFEDVIYLVQIAISQP